MSMTKRMIAMFLIFVTLSSVMVVAVSADNGLTGSNSRINTFLKMAEGSEITDEDISGLTTDQLQFLGVYLSNFYIPFGTEFGRSDSDDVSEKVKENMIQSLQTKLAFSDEMAEALVDTVVGLTRSSKTDLGIYIWDAAGRGYIKSDILYPNYATFFSFMNGRSSYVLGDYGLSAYDSVPIRSLYRGLDYFYNYDTTYLQALNMFTGNVIGDANAYGSIGEFYDKINEGVMNRVGVAPINKTTFDTVNYYKTFGEGTYLTNSSSIHSVHDDIPLSTLDPDFPDSPVTNVGGFLGSLDVYAYLLAASNINGEDVSSDYIQLYFSRAEGGKRYVPRTSGKTYFEIDFYSYEMSGDDDNKAGVSFVISEATSTPYVGLYSNPATWKSGDVDVYKLGTICIAVDSKLFKEAHVISSIKRGTDCDGKIYFGYEKDGEVVPVYDCVSEVSLLNGRRQLSPCQIQFWKCLELTNMENGYAINFFDFDTTEVEDKDEMDNMTQYLMTNSPYADDQTMLKATILGETMAVDCFGNILVMGANHQYVAIPGCMNPYVWQAVDSNGEDIGYPGDFLNIINAKNLVLSDLGMIGEVQDTSTYVSSSWNPNPANICNDMHRVCKISLKKDSFNADRNQIGDIFPNSIIGSGDDDNWVYARFARGMSECKLNTGWFIFTDEDKTEDAIDALIDKYYGLREYDYTNLIGEEDGSCWELEYFCLPGPWKRYYDKYNGTSWNSVNLCDGFVFIDSIGAYKNPDGTSKEFGAFQIEHYLNDEGESSGSVANTMSGNGFGSSMDKIVSGTVAIPDCTSAAGLSSIYISYVYAAFYTEENKADTIGKLGYRMAKDHLPNMPTEALQLDISGVMQDYQLNAIKDWTYYLLHPTKGFNYVKILITNKLNHLLLGWHSDMVGTNGVGVTTGTTKYRSTVGYVTMPDLSEIEWTDRLIGFYQDCIPFLIILIVVLMLFAFITGVLSLQRAILAAVLFSLFLMLPTTLINGAVQQSNLISQKIYGDKFVYWAMIQQETYAKQIDEAANMEGSSGDSSYSNYLRTLYGTNQEVYSNQGSESIVLKWQAPKKMSSLVLSSADQKSLSGLGDVGRSMLYGMLGRSYGGQSYVDDEDAVYMYRSYLDISNFSRYIYRGIHTNENSGGPYVKSNDEAMDVSKALKGTGGTLMFSDALSNAVSNMEGSFDQYRKDGYTTYSNGESSTNHSMSYVTVPMSSRVVADALKGKGSLSDFDDVNDLININQDLFNFGIPMFTNSTVSLKDVKTYAATGNIVEGTTRYTALNNSLSKYTEEDMTGLAAYALYSENVFYYYSWKMYNDGLNYKSSLSGGNGYKDLLLGKNDGGYFYKNEGNGGLRDFMDMRSLFTYIIPYMRECNELVREWDDTYGIFIYDGVPTEEGCWNEIGSDPELKAKYWHNLNVSRLYCVYCPWVDVMYDCSYAEPETITVLGSQYVVSDPLNPASYTADRPMIFSEAEMEDYGLSEGDLTAAERKILQCNEEMQERMYELLNYYNFSDITLDTAAAMQCAFTFNSVFSETGIMKENHNIYPQSYDLANFSYDAFLRMILSNSTGESMLNTSKSVNTAAGETSGDFYERVVNNSSTTTVIVMLILDVLSIYVLPAFKMFFLVAAFLASVLIVFVSLCKIEDNAKFLRKIASGFLLPLLKFFVITVVFSWVISLFMGTGNNSITQTNELSISLGDPVMVMLVMIAIDILVLFLYWKIIKGVLKVIKFNGKMALGFAGGVIGAVGGLAVGAVAGATHAASSTTDAAGRGIRRAQDRRHQKKVERGLEGLNGAGGGEQPAQNGTGVESDRAAQRAAENRNAAAGGESTPRQSNAGVGSGSATPKVRQPVKSAEDKASDKAKTEAINNKAMSGTQKLREKQRQAEEQRYDRYRQSAERDFGYARGEDGKIDPSKLNAKDKYKYDQRMKRTANRERAQSKADREALKAQYKKEYGGKGKGKSDSSKPKEDKKSDNKNK